MHPLNTVNLKCDDYVIESLCMTRIYNHCSLFIFQTSMTEYEEDKSVCSRYRKYSYWNPVLETEFLETLVSSYPTKVPGSRPAFHTEEIIEGKEALDNGLEPLMETRTWSLSLLDDTDNGNTSDLKDVRTDSVDNVDVVAADDNHDSILLKIKRRQANVKKSNRRKKRNMKILKDRMKGRGYTSYIQRNEDWKDLHLVQGLMEKNVSDEAAPEVSHHCDLAADIEAEEDENVSYHIDEVEKLVMEERDWSDNYCKDFRQNPIRNEIRKKVQSACDKGLIKFKSLNDIKQNYHPPVCIKIAKVS